MAIVPPAYGHITFDNSGKILMVIGGSESGFPQSMSRSDSLEKGLTTCLKRGFIRNSNHASTPEFENLETVDLKELGLFSGGDIYELMSILRGSGFW